MRSIVLVGEGRGPMLGIVEGRKAVLAREGWSDDIGTWTCC